MVTDIVLTNCVVLTIVLCCVDKTHINKIQIKQNHSARLIFFATDHGEHTESALPLLNLLDVLTVHNVYRFHILKFTYLWHKGLLPKSFSTYFQYASNVHKYNTRYASKQNLYVKKVRTNMGKQTIDPSPKWRPKIQIC